MVVVESFAICQYRHSDVLCWRDVSGNKTDHYLQPMRVVRLPTTRTFLELLHVSAPKHVVLKT
jgi:hypothetical protein